MSLPSEQTAASGARFDLTGLGIAGWFEDGFDLMSDLREAVGVEIVGFGKVRWDESVEGILMVDSK